MRIIKKNICGDKILFLSLQNKTDRKMPTLLTLFGLRFFFYMYQDEFIKAWEEYHGE